jgi:hypothetical protein
MYEVVISLILDFLNPPERKTSRQIDKTWNAAYRLQIQSKLRQAQCEPSQIMHLYSSVSKKILYSIIHMVNLNRTQNIRRLLSALQITCPTERVEIIAKGSQHPTPATLIRSDACMAMIHFSWLEMTHHTISETNQHQQLAQLTEPKKQMLLWAFAHSLINKDTLAKYYSNIYSLLSKNMLHSLEKKLIRHEHFRLQNLSPLLNGFGFKLLKAKQLTPEVMDSIPIAFRTFISSKIGYTLFQEKLISLKKENLVNRNESYLSRMITQNRITHLLEQINDLIGKNNGRMLLTYLRAVRPNMSRLTDMKNLKQRVKPKPISLTLSRGIL